MAMIQPCTNQPHRAVECLWCQSPIRIARRRGSAPKFCSPGHRFAFWKALRRRALTDFEAGVLTLEMLKGDRQRVHALPEGVQTLAHVKGASS